MIPLVVCDFQSSDPSAICIRNDCDFAIWASKSSGNTESWYFSACPFRQLFVRDTPSTAGNSMTGSERPSPEPLLKKEASPAVLGGREFWKCSGSLKCLEL